MKNIIIAILLAVLSGCTSPTAMTHFPPELGQKWYAKHYSALREMPIWPEAARDPKREIYRFLDLSVEPRLVRVDVARDGTRWITFKKTAEQVDYEPGELIFFRKTVMQQQDFDLLTNLLAQAGFWSLPHQMPEQSGKDGSHKIIEIVKEGKYHVVDWWSPRDGPFAEACTHLLRLGFEEELNIPPAFFFCHDYDRVSVDFAPLDSEDVILSWKTKADVVSALGIPHKADTRPDQTTWSYFCRHRQTLTLRFDGDGRLTNRTVYESGYFQKEEDNQASQGTSLRADPER